MLFRSIKQFYHVNVQLKMCIKLFFNSQESFSVGGKLADHENTIS
jgi:hypothetical protein